MAFDESYGPILNRRYCREYFAMLGFLKKNNQYDTYKWDIELVKQQIGLLLNPNDPRGYDYDSSSPECPPVSGSAKEEVAAQ